MPKQFKKAASFLTVLGLLTTFAFSANTSYAMTKQTNTKQTTKVLSSLDALDSDDLFLDIDWGFDFDDEDYEDLEQDGFYYVVNDKNEAIITYYYLDEANVSIPSKLNGYPVTMIYYDAFSCLEKTKTVTIPNSLKVIGGVAFFGCEKLQSVNIADGVTKLGEGIFAFDEKLSNVTLPNTIDSIPAETFFACTSLKKINIPSSVKTIEDEAFAMTGFTEFTVPDSVTTLGEGVFAYCENLTKVTIPKSVTQIGDDLFEECEKTVTIYGEKGSYAETYAKENNIPFKDINAIEQDEKVIATGKTTSGLNVRSGAGTGYSKIGYLNKGTKVEVVSKLSNGWYKIKYNGSYGYVSGKYVKLDSSQSEVIATGKTTTGLNVRAGAGTGYSKIGYLSKGTKVEVVSKLSNGWYKIKYNGSYGYISGKYVKLDSSQSEVIATGKTTAGLNVRAGAGTGYSKIGYLSKGTKVEIVSKLSNGWYKIKYNGSYGYVSGKYVKLDGSQSEVIATGKTTAGLNVRSGAGTNYKKIGYLGKGTKVEIVVKYSNGWYKIKYNGSYGYVSGQYVKLS